MTYRLHIGVVVLAMLAAGRARAAEVMVLQGATVETCAEAGRMENVSILVRDGKIESIGKDVKIPIEARLVDLGGKVVMPGIIDPYYAIPMAGQSVTSTRQIVIGGRVFTITSRRTSTSLSFVRIADNFYPYDVNFRTALRSGVTLANLVSGGYGVAATGRPQGAKGRLELQDRDGVMFTLVTNDSSSLDVLRKGLGVEQPKSDEDASKAASSSSARAAALARARAARSASATDKLWKEVAEGKRRLLVNTDNPAAILHLIKAVESKEKLKLTVLASGASIYETRDALAAQGCSLILRPTIDTVPNTRNLVCIPKLMHEAGVKFAFSLSLSRGELSASQDAPLVRVAYTVKAGLPRQVALAALTTTPARLLGLEKTHGSIESGKYADLLVFDGDPLDAASRLERVYVQGRQVYGN